jgi:hypothetical protein
MVTDVLSAYACMLSRLWRCQLLLAPCTARTLPSPCLRTPNQPLLSLLLVLLVLLPLPYCCCCYRCCLRCVE